MLTEHSDCGIPDLNDGVECDDNFRTWIGDPFDRGIPWIAFRVSVFVSVFVRLIPSKQLKHSRDTGCAK